MSYEFTKTEQHRLAKRLFSGLVSFVNVALSTAKHYSDVYGITFSWYGPKANVPQEPSVAVYTEDRTIVVRRSGKGTIVAFSEKNVGRRQPGPPPKEESHGSEEEVPGPTTEARK